MRTTLVIAIVLLSGCTSFPFSRPPCPQPVAWFLAGPLDAQGRLFVDEPGQEPAFQRVLYWMENPSPKNASLDFALFAHGQRTGQWFSEHINDTGRTTLTAPSGTKLGGATPLFNRTDQVQPGMWRYDASATLRAARPANNCRTGATVSTLLEFAQSSRGKTAYPGVGAIVMTAGFWLNGTLFYTNMDSVNNDTRIHKGGWYDFEGHDPLKVYIYNQSRAELPPRYNASGFLTTIPGFNNALKQMSTHASRVASLKPDEAYTTKGNEGKPLYGDPLVFYIEILDVVAIPCPQPQPVCEAPTVPSPPDGRP